MQRLNNIIMHCSDSNFGCVREIRNWHLERGWRDIGYHFVVMNGFPVSGLYIPTLCGSIECGRYLNEDLMVMGQEIGAHALGYNDKSIGVCVVGKDHFADVQMVMTRLLVRRLCFQYKIPVENVLGHCETESGKAQGKTCPNFDMDEFRKAIRVAM